MVSRFQPKATAKAPKRSGGAYFKGRQPPEFFSTGCTLTNCILGGGWVLGRPVNIVGDKSVGKTLKAIEAAANFARKYPRGHIWYRESEAAFDISYAEVVGLPSDRVDFGADGPDTLWDTIDEVWDDLKRCIAKALASGQPGLYIIDSLDALTDKDEKNRDRNKGSYGTAKPKAISELFRTLVRDMRKAKVTLMIISQIRDNINAFANAPRYKIAGGKALDFYATQRLYLAHIGTITRTINGLKRTTGVRIKAKCTKNKVGQSFGECEFVIRFGYGVDDLLANVDWLEAVKALEDVGTTKTGVDKFIKQVDRLPDSEHRAKLVEIQNAVIARWESIAEESKPVRRKYG